MHLNKNDSNWFALGLDALEYQGFFVLEDVYSGTELARTRQAMYDVQDRIRSTIGADKLSRAGERGVLRVMMQYDPAFVRFLETPEILRVVDEVLSSTSILHLQNGFILPSEPKSEQAPLVFQSTFHQDFRRALNGYRASLNALISVDGFTAENGATLMVPGTHLKERQPQKDYLSRNAVAVECPPGSVIFFESTLWHAAGRNHSGKDRLAINHQFTRSFLKQQIDYPRALGESFITKQTERTQQLLGWFTRVPADAEQYYVPPAERTYRAEQG